MDVSHERGLLRSHELDGLLWHLSPDVSERTGHLSRMPEALHHPDKREVPVVPGSHAGQPQDWPGVSEIDDIQAPASLRQEPGTAAVPGKMCVFIQPEEGPNGAADREPGVCGKGADMKAPFPYFGGKTAVAPVVWAALGQPKHYIEPFFGSGAVLLARTAKEGLSALVGGLKTADLWGTFDHADLRLDDTGSLCDEIMKFCSAELKKSDLPKKRRKA